MLTLWDVTLRDGLQSISKDLTTEQKFSLYRSLCELGIEHFEYTSFVSQKLVPQLADAPKLTAEIIDNKLLGKFATALVLNLKGAQRAISNGVKSSTIVVSSCEDFSLRNSGLDFSNQDLHLQQIAKLFCDEGVIFRGSISMAFGNASQQSTIERVIHYCQLFMSLGAFEVSLADTASNLDPKLLVSIYDQLKQRFPKLVFNLHLHGTSELLLSTVNKALELGITSFDISLLGVGGCPNIDGHHGNLSYRTLLAGCDAQSIDVALDRDKLSKLEKEFSEITS